MPVICRVILQTVGSAVARTERKQQRIEDAELWRAST